MASTFTANLGVEKPGSGDYAGTWDSPVNSNMGVLDSALGSIQAISLAAGSVTLSTAQTRSAFLNFSGALPGNVTVTIPTLSSAPGTTLSGKGYVVQNQCSNSSNFTVTLATTVPTQQVVCVPPYEPVDVLIEGTGSSQAGSIKFRNFGRIGGYWDYAGTAVPSWVTGCTVPPYLYCNGTTFSSATYPALTSILGSTTLPDMRGRSRIGYNDGTGRVTSGSSTGGVDGNTLFASGGNQTVVLSSQNVPPVSANSTASSIVTQTRGFTGPAGGAVQFAVRAADATATDTTVSSLASITVVGGSTSPTNFSIIQPAVVFGITMIRAA